MELTNEALDQIRSEIHKAMDAQEKEMVPAGIPISVICDNKEIIIGFINILIGLLPGILGKLVGQVIVKAAEAWFEKKKCP